MDISEVEKILAEHPLLPKPRYVLLTEEPVTANVDGMLVFRGLTPKWRKDAIVLTPLANDETVVHEVLHTLGFGELGAYTLAPLLRRLRKLLPPLLRGNVKYRFKGYVHPKIKLYERVE